MPDVQFGQLRDGSDGLNVFIGQAVPRVGFNAIDRRKRCHIRNALQLHRYGITLRMGIFTSVEFHHRRAQFHRRFDLARFGRDEQAYTDPGVRQA